MRLSELLDTKVVGVDGRTLGKVRDVRLVQDGPLQAGVQSAFRLDAIVVSRGWRGVRLGYLRNEVRGPWLLRTIFRALERRAAQIIPARDVEWDREVGVVRVTAAGQASGA